MPKPAALDDRDWDTWLAFYAPDARASGCQAWDDNDRLVENPQAEISLDLLRPVAAASRIASSRHQDRTVERQPPPEPAERRTIFQMSKSSSRTTAKSELRFKLADAQLTVTKSSTPILELPSTRSKLAGERPLIKAQKKVILKNDYIHHVIDVYHI